MRKLAALIVLLAPATAIAEDAPLVRDSYVGIYAIQSRYAVKFSEPAETRGYRAAGPGFTFGAGLAGNFKVEAEATSARLRETSGPWNSSYADNYNLMVNGKYAYELWGFFRPYAGIGIGPSYWITSGGGRWNFSYQALAGTVFNLTNVFDIDFGVKIQNLGRMPDDYVFATTGGVINTEMRIGVLWRY